MARGGAGKQELSSGALQAALHTLEFTTEDVHVRVPHLPGIHTIQRSQDHFLL